MVKLSTALIVLILVWIIAQNVRGIAYTQTQTNLFIGSSAVLRLTKVNWNPVARLKIDPVDSVPALPDWLSTQMPFERKLVEIGSLKIHYIDDGPKNDPNVPTVLLIHGDPGWCYSWRLVIQQLKKKQTCRIIAPDLIGYGLSEKPTFLEHIGIRPENQMRIIAALIEYINPKSLIVVGGGWGGLIAAGVCRRQAERLYGTVLMNTAIRNPREKPRILSIARLSNLPYIGAFCFRWLNLPTLLMHYAWGKRIPFNPDLKKAYLWGTGGISPWNWSERCASLSFARAMPAPVGFIPTEFHSGKLLLRDAEEWASRYGMPCELVWGEADPYVGKSLRRTEDAFVASGARVYRTALPDVGHFVQEEAPEEVVAAILRIVSKMKQYFPNLVVQSSVEDE